jgi:sugar lactone lactonase YvrE
LKPLLSLSAILLLAPTFVLAAHRIIIENVGFAAPESIVHDERHDVYLLSNVNGRAIDNDGNGFISKISPDGKVLDLKWIDGQTPGITLHAPKGLAISGNTLYVADNGDDTGNVIRLFDLTSGRPTGEIPIPGSLFLNGLTPLPSGEILVTDSGWRLSLTAANKSKPPVPGAQERPDGSTWTPTGRDAIYRIGLDHRVSTFVKTAELLQPNGITTLPSGNLLTVSSSAPWSYELTPDGRKTNIRHLPDRGFDGIGQAPGGCIYTAGPEKLYRVCPDAQVETIAGIDTHVADLHFDRKRNRILLPLLRANKVIIETLELF